MAAAANGTASDVRANVAKLEKDAKAAAELTAAEMTKAAVIAKAISDMAAKELADKQADHARRLEHQRLKKHGSLAEQEAAAAKEAECAMKQKEAKKLRRKLSKKEARAARGVVTREREIPIVNAAKEALLTSIQSLVPEVVVPIGGQSVRIDPVMFAEAELQRATYTPSVSVKAESATSKREVKLAPNVAVLSKNEKWRKVNRVEEAHAQLLSDKRAEWLTNARMKWIAYTRAKRIDDNKDQAAQYANRVAVSGNKDEPEPVPMVMPTIEEAVDMVPDRFAEEAVTLDTILGMSPETKVEMTEREINASKRAQAAKMAEAKAQQQASQEERLASMPEHVRNMHIKHQKRLIEMQTYWMTQEGLDHDARRAMRAAEFDQMIRQQSRKWHEHALWLYNNGAPVVDRNGDMVAVVDPVTKKPVIDPVTGKKTPMRHAAHQKVYIEFSVPPESFTENAREWLPAKDARVFTEAQAKQSLEEQEEHSDDPRMTVFEREQRAESVALIRKLVSHLEECDPQTMFVYKLAVQCDGIRPGAIGGHSLGPRMIFAVSSCGFNEQKHKDRIAALGPLKERKQMCAFCDGYILVPASMFRVCGTCRENPKTKVHATKHQFFCSKPCKESHVARMHKDSKPAKRKQRKANLKARKLVQNEEEKRRADLRRARDIERGNRQVEAMDVGVGYGFSVPDNFFEEEWPEPEPARHTLRRKLTTLLHGEEPNGGPLTDALTADLAAVLKEDLIKESSSSTRQPDGDEVDTEEEEEMPPLTDDDDEEYTDANEDERYIKYTTKQQEEEEEAKYDANGERPRTYEEELRR